MGFTQPNYAVLETAGAAVINVVLQNASSLPDGSQVTVHYQTGSGTATVGADYLAASGDLTLTKAGIYTLVARATDNDGATATSSSVITVVNSNGPPAVSLSAPPDGSSFMAPVNLTIRADASDPDGRVARVDFYANGTLLGSSSASPFSLVWSNVAAGNYLLTATATDAGGPALTV